MLTTKRLAGFAPEINLREHEICMPLPSVNKVAQSSFETQRKCHQNSKIRGISGPTKRTCVLQKLKENVPDFPLP